MDGAAKLRDRLTREMERVLLLSSKSSAYGGQVLYAAERAGLRLVSVIVEEAPARGGINRLGLYRKRYGPSAILVRSVEMLTGHIANVFRRERVLAPIEEVAVRLETALEPVKNLNDPEAHAVMVSYDPALALLGGTGILDVNTIAQFPDGRR